MEKRRFLGLMLCWYSVIGAAIVQRHDEPESDYLVGESGPHYMIDLPHEGHGVLVSEQWVVTVAHTIFYDYRDQPIEIHGVQNQITQVVFHPGFKKIPKHLLQGDSKPLMDFLFQRSDIALIKLKDPVKHIQPISLYEGSDEAGKTVVIYGKGATGSGLTGEIGETKHAKKLRHCRNVITTALDSWLAYVFDSPGKAIPLEGMHGSGDSGGPAVLYFGQKPYLAGLSSWQMWRGEISEFKGGLYGAKAYQVRISGYVKWIHSVMKGG